MELDIKRLIEDLGGARHLANNIGVGRTVPYGWVRRGSVSSNKLALIKRAYPELDLDTYFTVKEDNYDNSAERLGCGS